MKRRHFIWFGDFLSFYLCKIYSQEFCIYNTNVLRQIDKLTAAEELCGERRKKTKKNRTVQQLRRRDSPGSRENIQHCVKTSAQRRK